MIVSNLNKKATSQNNDWSNKQEFENREKASL